MSEAADVERMIEALLFAAASPLSVDDLKFRLPEGAAVIEGLTHLQARYEGRGVRLVEVGGRWRFETAPDLAFLMTLERDTPRRLSRATQETLAIIAYHQPVTRADIEAIRGVQTSRGTLDTLMELGLIRMRGRRRTPGRPVTWGTTTGFLEHYGLASLGDLPGAVEMTAAGLLAPGGAADLAIPTPGADVDDEDPLDDVTAEFHRDFLKDDEAGLAEGSPRSDGVRT